MAPATRKVASGRSGPSAGAARPSAGPGKSGRATPTAAAPSGPPGTLQKAKAGPTKGGSNSAVLPVRANPTKANGANGKKGGQIGADSGKVMCVCGEHEVDPHDWSTLPEIDLSWVLNPYAEMVKKSGQQKAVSEVDALQQAFLVVAKEMYDSTEKWKAQNPEAAAAAAKNKADNVALPAGALGKGSQRPPEKNSSASRDNSRGRTGGGMQAGSRNSNGASPSRNGGSPNRSGGSPSRGNSNDSKGMSGNGNGRGAPGTGNDNGGRASRSPQPVSGKSGPAGPPRQGSRPSQPPSRPEARR